MIYFKENYLIIEIKTHNPIETWLAINSELLNLFQCINEEMTVDASHHAVFNLLQSLMPDLQTAQRMKSK